MNGSVIGTTYDLLAFHGSGSTGLFDRCFDKAVKYHDIKLDDEKKTLYRRWSFQYLRTLGYIDVFRREAKWCLSPATLVQRRDDEFVLIGSSERYEQLRKAAFSSQVRQVSQSDVKLACGTTLFPDIFELRATTSEAARLASKIGVELSLDYQDNLFRSIPRISTVLETTLQRDTAAPLFEPNSAAWFSLEQRSWQPYAEMQALKPGLYKTELRYAAPRYFVASSRADDSLETFFVSDSEWALICLHAKLDLKLPIRYSTIDETLWVSRGGFAELRLPTLLERCLRSGMLSQPGLDQNWSKYANLRHKNVWRLLAKFPIFSLEFV